MWYSSNFAIFIAILQKSLASGGAFLRLETFTHDPVDCFPP